MNSNPGLARLLSDAVTPRWLKEVDQFLPIKSQFVLHGNIRDLFPMPADNPHESNFYVMTSTHQYLVDYLALKGYLHFFLVNPQQGITLLVPSDATDIAQYAVATAAWADRNVRVNREINDMMDGSGAFTFKSESVNAPRRAKAHFSDSMRFVEAVVQSKAERCAVFFDYMMGLGSGGQSADTDPFVRALMMSHEAMPIRGFYNTLFWLCDRENELPAWLTLNNACIRSIGMPTPDGGTRTLVGNSLLRETLPEMKALSVEAAAKVVDEFGRQTNGLLMRDLKAIVSFVPSQGLRITEIGEAARRYKLGVTEDPWRKITDAHLRNAEVLIRDRVKGQERAIQKSLDTLRKSIMGVSGAYAGRSSGKPKGVLFFAGPTGVGKTELAKSITEAIFGDEHAYIRFDMSEFNHEHADQRLIGAPPGYLGFEAGGELTQAIRQRPFSLVLFDEIEKAHPKILDKFLQILDDGQLTSGKGERVYFSEAIIVFTSNLGMSAARPSDEYIRLEETLRKGIAEHFTSAPPKGLNRPELLNRIGDNIVIFDFIRPDIGVQILRKMLRNVLLRVQEAQGITLWLDGFNGVDDTSAPTGVFKQLVDRCTGDLSNGGRGIGNMLETALLDPLSRAIWNAQMKPGKSARIAELTEIDGRETIRLEFL